MLVYVIEGDCLNLRTKRNLFTEIIKGVNIYFLYRRLINFDEISLLVRLPWKHIRILEDFYKMQMPRVTMHILKICIIAATNRARIKVYFKGIFILDAIKNFKQINIWQLKFTTIPSSSALRN